MCLVGAAVLLPLRLSAGPDRFSKTDHRRQADAVVVFGARTCTDGTLSDAFADRVRTACRHYLSGLTPTVIMSGRPGNRPNHETEAMRNMAVSAGVPDKAIVLDADGSYSIGATVPDGPVEGGPGPRLPPLKPGPSSPEGHKRPPPGDAVPVVKSLLNS